MRYSRLVLLSAVCGVALPAVGQTIKNINALPAYE